MGLVVYKPPDKKRDWHWFKFAASWVFWMSVIELGTSFGGWLHTGVWHW